MRTYSSKEIQEMEKTIRTNLINCLSGFKSLNLCGTKGTDGVENLAIFNSVHHLGANPPLMGMIFRPDSVDRHTLSNIRNLKYYTLNSVTEEIYKEAHQSSARYPNSVSEFDAVNLEKEYLEGFQAPFVKKAPIKIGLEMREEIQIKSNGTYLLVGEILHLSISSHLVMAEDGFLDLTSENVVTGIGLDGYCKTQLLERLPYAKP